MKYAARVTDIATVTELPDYWTEADLRALLEALDVQDVAEVPAAELRDYLALALTDLEPAEGAAAVLRYKLGDALSEGQIEQVSHDMLDDRVAEEYPDILLHERLWHCNQLLYRAYNGKFPSTKASVITAELRPLKGGSETLDEAAVLQILSAGLNAHAVMPRLLEPQLKGEEAFPTAEGILWTVTPKGEHVYELLTSAYWLSEEDFGAFEFEGEVRAFEEEED